jgi:hypothetical protein
MGGQRFLVSPSHQVEKPKGDEKPKGEKPKGDAAQFASSEHVHCMPSRLAGGGGTRRKQQDGKP